MVSLLVHVALVCRARTHTHYQRPNKEGPKKPGPLTGAAKAKAAREKALRKMAAANRSAASGKPKPPHPGPIYHFTFSHDSTMLVTGSANGVVEAWDITTGDILWSVAATEVAKGLGKRTKLNNNEIHTKVRGAASKATAKGRCKCTSSVLPFAHSTCPIQAMDRAKSRRRKRGLDPDADPEKPKVRAKEGKKSKDGAKEGGKEGGAAKVQDTVR